MVQRNTKRQIGERVETRFEMKINLKFHTRWKNISLSCRSTRSLVSFLCIGMWCDKMNHVSFFTPCLLSSRLSLFSYFIPISKVDMVIFKWFTCPSPSLLNTNILSACISQYLFICMNDLVVLLKKRDLFFLKNDPSTATRD